jgi:N-acylneuraminate cytidylyltransferase
MMHPPVVAIIPARGGSTGIPRKNLAIVAGKPLVVHAIEQALAARTIDRVIVNSEDEEIRAVAAAAGAEVMDRPDEFAHDTTVQEVDRLLRWCVLDLERRSQAVGLVVLLYPTSPLRRVGTIDEAVRLVRDGDFDSVLSLVEDTTYLWRREGDLVRPTNYDPRTRGPRQKEEWNQWAENKAVYVMGRDLLVDTGCRIGGRVGFVAMSKLESVDVDAPEDLELVRALMEREVRT